MGQNQAMKPRNQVSRSAIELIKRFEGYRRKSARLADGRWTIGYGHTLTAREGVEVSEQDAEALLIYDLIAVSHSVNEWVFTPLTQNQFDALVAFAFNIGLDNFRHSSVLRRLNEGAMIQAACAMELWRKAEFEGETIVVDALVRRRSAEKTLFLTPAEGWRPAPSPVLRPNLDHDIYGVVPRQTPTALNTPLEGATASAERDEARQEHPQPLVIEDDDAQGPAASAAASVSTRLSAIFREPADTPIPPVEPRLVIEELDAPLTPGLSPDFVLTPPEDEFPSSEAFAAAPHEYVAANESEPGLFDPREMPPEVEAELELTDAVPTPVEDDAPDYSKPERRKSGLGPAVGLAGAGVTLFGGCLFWAINMPAPQGHGALNPGTVVWLAGIAGVGLIGIAVYLILDRLGRPPIEHVDGVIERDE